MSKKKPTTDRITEDAIRNELEVSTAYYPNTSSTLPIDSTSGIVSSAWSWNTPYEVVKKSNCRLCGKEFEMGEGNVSLISSVLCKRCANKAVEKIIREAIPSGSKVHCKKCFSHIKACECKAKQELDQL